MSELKDKKDPAYCPECLIVIEWIERSEKLKHIGKIITCNICKQEYILNESRYMLLKYKR